MMCPDGVIVCCFTGADADGREQRTISQDQRRQSEFEFEPAQAVRQPCTSQSQTLTLCNDL